MRAIVAAGAALAIGALSASAQTVTEPVSGVVFAANQDGLSLLGAGVRTRTLFKVKVYAIALYVDDAALGGPLAAQKGNLGSPAFYEQLVSGDFRKELHLTFVRDIDRQTIQRTLGDAFSGADRAKVERFTEYFPAIRAGQTCVIRWEPGGTLATSVAGVAKPPIADKRFAAAVFGLWLGERPVQESIRTKLISRASELIR
jgi:hypothetical protein